MSLAEAQELSTAIQPGHRLNTPTSQEKDNVKLHRDIGEIIPVCVCMCARVPFSTRAAR